VSGMGKYLQQKMWLFPLSKQHRPHFFLACSAHLAVSGAQQSPGMAELNNPTIRKRRYHTQVAFYQ
jgi:hypothetical protein